MGRNCIRDATHGQSPQLQSGVLISHALIDLGHGRRNIRIGFIEHHVLEVECRI